MQSFADLVELEFGKGETMLDILKKLGLPAGVAALVALIISIAPFFMGEKDRSKELRMELETLVDTNRAFVSLLEKRSATPEQLQEILQNLKAQQQRLKETE